MTDVERAGSGLHTLLVDDLDGFMTELAEREIVAGPAEVISAGVRETVVIGGDGNRLKVGQVHA